MTAAAEPGGFPPPRRRLNLELSLQADDLDELTAALAEVQATLAYEGIENSHRETFGIWSSSRLNLDCDESMTAERYRELSARYRKAVHEAAAGGGS